jgi:4-amino-4-deoxy-L-arabinose transferase-like glycosyltransferase
MIDTFVARSRKHAALLAVLCVGLAVRLVLLAGFSGTGLEIEDEKHYHEIASSLLEGDGFAREGRLTSMRPPLYPALVAGVGFVAGIDNLQAVRLVQILLSLGNVVLIYVLGRQMFSHRVGLIAASLFCFYPSLVVYDFLILSEVLFTFLLTLTVAACVQLLKDSSFSAAAVAGSALGLAALTRSVLWPFPLLLCPMILLLSPAVLQRRAGLAALVLASYAAVVAPWAVRNTQLQQVPVVIDTMGGINLRLGNFEHTPHVRMWDGVSMTGEKSWSHELRIEHSDAASWTEGQKEKWAQRKAIEFMLANPALTLKRSLIKFADFWGLEREVLAGLQRGNYKPPPAVTAATVVLITLAYPALILLAVLGVFFNSSADWRVHATALSFVMFVCGIHVLVYGHSRYHVPLVAILVIYAAAAVENRAWRHLYPLTRKAAPAIGVFCVLSAAWVYQALLDADRIRGLLGTFWQ